nr:MAG TPA: HPr Serine kinase C-terminal domain [Caudoviricetes sp.]
MLNPIASSVVIGGKKLFEPTTTESGKTTTFAE